MILLKTSEWTKQFYLWDIQVMPCSPLKANRPFGGTRYLHLHGQGTSQARNQREAGGKQSSASHLLIPTARRFTFSGLHGIMYQETELFITTGART
jgi:hypothetical protein